MFTSNDNPRRPNSLRLTGYDYGSVGVYHVVIGTDGKRPLLGRAVDTKIQRSPIGLEVERCWLEIPKHYHGVLVDAYSLMPDHFHGIVILVDPQAGDRNIPPRELDLPAVVQRFKSFTTHVYRKLVSNLGDQNAEALWQRGYWDEIINSERQLESVREYITNNALTDYLKQVGLL